MCFGLNKNLGFLVEDCEENICWIGEVVKLFVDVGVIMLMVFILLYWVDCDKVWVNFEVDEFIEVFVDMLFEVCE